MERKKIAKAFRHAFPYTVPIFAGFWFLAFAYGIYMHVSGFGFLYPTLMSLTIYGGSLEFVAVSMLLSPFAPLQAFLMSLMIQARHLFYGISVFGNDVTDTAKSGRGLFAQAQNQYIATVFGLI